MRPLGALTDPELAFRVQDGDERAFEVLLERYEGLVVYHAKQFGLRGEQQADIVQAGRLGLLKAAKTFRSDRGSGFSNFAKIAIYSEIVTFVKGALVGKHRVLSESARFEQESNDDLDEIASSEPSPHDQLVAKERLAQVVSIVTEQCSPLERTVAVRRLNGLSLAEAGKGLGRSAKPFKTADNALAKVRARLAA
jgi:RNA polymerase sporulation-specific sigma factor